MKDTYSFDLDKAGAIHSYNKMFVAYLRTFARMGLKAIPMRADTGPIGGDLSHEFIVLAETGESAVFCHKRPGRQGHPEPHDRLRRRPAADRQRMDVALRRDRRDARQGRASRPRSPEGERLAARGIEVGHIFYFGTKYSKPMKRRRRRPGRRARSRSRWAPTASACRAWSAASSRRATTRPASSGRSRSRRSRSAIVNLQARRRRASRAPARELYDALPAKGVEVLHDDRDDRGRAPSSPTWT